jgi:pilus assembly protein Flp/PilA
VMTQLQVKVLSTFSSLLTREEGQTMVEYALILALVSVAAIALLKTLGTGVSGVFSKVNADFKL